MPIPLKLTVFRGDEPVAEHRFERDIIKIGRLASAHLKLDDARVSRIHAVIESGGEGREYAIIDMGSTEGTFVNGRKVSKERLSNGDEIVLGEHRVVVGLGLVPAQTGPVPALTGAAGPVFSAGEVIASMSTGDVLGVAPDPTSAVASGMAAPAYGPVTGSALGPLSSPAMGPVTSPAMGPAVGPGYVPQASAAAAISGSYLTQSETPPLVPADAPAWTDASYAAYPPTAIPGGPQAAQGSLAAAALGSAVGTARPPVSAVSSGPGAALDSGSGYHPGWAPPSAVPNNLASSGVPEDERALEIKLIWGSSVLETLTVTEASRITLGDERRVSGFGPFQKVVRCDLEVPSHRLPSKTHVLARRQGKEGTTYALEIPAGLVGRVERANGMVVPLELLYAGQHGGQPTGEGGIRYLVQPEETLYLGYEHLVLQVRYVRRTQLPPVSFWSRINYSYANTLILALFVHIMTIASFIATPAVSAQLTDELYKNRNRFIETRLKEAERKRTAGGGILDELKKKGLGDKATKQEGQAGTREGRKSDAKMASKGKPDEKEQARRALDKLLGLSGRGSAAGIFGGRGLGGDLESAMGGLTGRQIGDARGLGGLGTRGSGPGGGGLSMSSVGLGTLGTAGRGGGGEGGVGYGSGAASLGGKKEREIEISAGQAIVRGSLSKEIIRRVIQKHQAQIRYCYEKELQRSPGLYGKVATEFVIDARGLVESARVIETNMNNKEVGRCITAKILTWRFPEPKGGGIVVVKYPFLFKSSG